MVSHNAFADQVVTTIGVGSAPEGITVNPNTNMIYVRGENVEGYIDVINGSNNVLQSTIGASSWNYFLTVNPKTNLIYFPNSYSGPATVSVVNGSTNALVTTIPIAYTPHAISVNPNTNKIYVASYGNSPDTVSVIDGSTNKVTSTVQVGTYSIAIAVNPNTNKIYVANQLSNTVSVIDGSTDLVTSTIQVGNSPLGIAINPVTNMIYVANSGDSSISVINGSTNALVSTIPIGSVAGAIAVNPLTDKIYIARGSSGVEVINGTTYVFIQDIPVVGNSWGLGTNPLTDRIYSVDANSSSYRYSGYVSVIQGGSSLSPSTSQLQVNSQDSGGNTLTGFFTTLSSNGKQVVTGFTPAQFTLNDTQAYTVTIANFGKYVFDHWADTGSTSSTRNISITSNSTITAVYDTVPHPPTNLAATASSQVSLSWTAPSGNGGSAITSYNVYRGASSGSETLLATAGNVTSYTDNTVTNGQTYYYRVTAVNSAGESPPSNEAYATPVAPATVSSAPTSLTATTVSSSQINLNWITPSSNGGSQVTGYMIQRSTDSGATWSTIASNTGSTATKYNDTGLSPSTTYAYQVSAINSVGTSATSNTASATTSAVQPIGIVLNNVQSTSGTASSSNQITLSNFNTGSGSNNLLVVGVGANNAAVSSVTFGGVQLTKAVSSFSNNDAEFWYMTNPSATGNIVVTMSGPTSAVVGAYSLSGVNQTVPIPTHLAKHNTTPNSPNISITTKYPNDWVLDLPSIYGGETLGSPTCTPQWNVNILNAITGASSSAVVQSPTTVTCSWTASSADLWDDVAVEVGSYTTSGASTSTATTPSAPTGLTSTSGNAQVTLSWTAPSSNGGSTITGYKIYRSTSSGTETFLTQAGNVTSYTDMGLTNGATYFYKVTAVNSVGESSQSNEVSTMPAAPTSTSSDKVITTIPFGHQLIAGIGDNPNTNKIYVASSNNSTSVSSCCPPNNKLFVIDGSTDTVLGNMTVGPSGTFATFVGVNPITDRIYVTSWSPEGGVVSVVDGATDKVIDTISSVGDPEGIAVNPSTNRIYVGDTGLHNLYVIDGTTDSVVNTIALGGEPRGVAVNPSTNKIYVDLPFNNNTVLAIDGSTNSIMGTISVGNDPQGIAVNPSTNKVYVTNEGSPSDIGTTVSVIDGSTNTVTDTIQVGHSPFEVTANPSTNKIYVTNNFDNTVSVIDGSTDSVVGTLPGGWKPVGVGVNPSTNKIYVGAGCHSFGCQGTVTVIQGSSSGTASGITLNNVQSTSGATSSSNQITLSNFNAGTASNRLLLVGVSANNNNVASVTFNGTPLTKVVSSFVNNDAELWYLTDPSSTGNIAVTMNGATQAVVGAYSFSGVNQSSPIPAHRTNHNTSAGSPSISVTTQYANDWVIDLPSIYGGSTLGSPTCTQEWDVNMPNAITGASSSTMVSSPSTVTCKWSASSADFWDDVAVELRAN